MNKFEDTIDTMSACDKKKRLTNEFLHRSICIVRRLYILSRDNKAF